MLFSHKVFDVPSGANFLPSQSEDNEVEVPWGKGILGWVAETGETVNLDVAYEVSGAALAALPKVATYFIRRVEYTQIPCTDSLTFLSSPQSCETSQERISLFLFSSSG